MKFLPTSVEIHIARYMLRRCKGYERLKKGVNLRGAEQVILVYSETDESKYKLVKDIAIYLKKEYDIKHIMRLAYVNAEEKAVPNWHMRKLESDFFCKSDLNWFLKPIRSIQAIQQEPYDILIHLDPDEYIPLDFFVAESRAKLKVANYSTSRTEDFDILLPPKTGDSWKQRNHRIIEFLADSPLT